MIRGWWQLAAWMPRLLLSCGVLLLLLFVLFVVRQLLGMFRS